MTFFGIVATAVVFGGLGFLLGALMSAAKTADEASEMQARLKQQSEAIIELSLKNAHYRMEYLRARANDMEDDLR